MEEEHQPVQRSWGRVRPGLMEAQGGGLGRCVGLEHSELGGETEVRAGR